MKGYGQAGSSVASLASVVSFLLIGFSHHRRLSRTSAIRALLVTGGGLALFRLFGENGRNSQGCASRRGLGGVCDLRLLGFQESPYGHSFESRNRLPVRFGHTHVSAQKRGRGCFRSAPDGYRGRIRCADIYHRPVRENLPGFRLRGSRPDDINRSTAGEERVNRFVVAAVQCCRDAVFSFIRCHGQSRLLRQGIVLGEDGV